MYWQTVSVSGWACYSISLAAAICKSSCLAIIIVLEELTHWYVHLNACLKIVQLCIHTWAVISLSVVSQSFNKGSMGNWVMKKAVNVSD